MSCARLKATVIGALFLTAACEGPLLPAPSPWRPVVELPHLFIPGDVCVGPDATVVYVAGYMNGEGKAVIYSCPSAPPLKEDFRSPWEESDLFSLSAGGGLLWAAGSKYGAGKPVPYVVRLKDDDWTEVEVPAEFGDSYLMVCGCEATGVPYFIGDEGVYRLEGSAWYKIFDIAAHKESTRDEFRAVATAGGRVFIYQYAFKFPARSLGYVYVSYDRGGTFRREEFQLPDKYWRISGPEAVTLGTARETLYLATEVETSNGQPTAGYHGIVRRDGAAPGAGRYYLEFFAPMGPYFTGGHSTRLKLAFRAADDGYAAGSETSVRLKAGRWQLDNNSRESNFTFRCLDAGPASYWAVIGVEDPLNVDKLFYAEG